MSYTIGQKVEGIITGIQSYGIFVQLDDHVQGLVHISEITYGYVEDIKNKHKVGEKVEVVIMDIDEYSKKISLSIRSANMGSLKKSKGRTYHPRYSNLKSERGFQSLEEKMPQWIDETLKYLEKNTR